LTVNPCEMKETLVELANHKIEKMLTQAGEARM
jgi:hypothetical protein